MVYTFDTVNGDLQEWGAKLQRLGADEFSDWVGSPIIFKPVNGPMTRTLTLQGETFF